jgi:hypothetical protein
MRTLEHSSFLLETKMMVLGFGSAISVNCQIKRGSQQKQILSTVALRSHAKDMVCNDGGTELK